MTYSVTIHIANRGTHLSNGETSFAGHMWYEITDYSSKPESYGFGPLKHGSSSGPGYVYNNDSDNYQSTVYSRTIEITKEQYKKRLENVLKIMDLIAAIITGSIIVVLILHGEP